jgi:hypothetical protein
MSSDIEKAKSFEEKMKERIKDGIGDLLSDDDIKKLIDAGMQDTFFKPSKIKVNAYDHKDGPTLLQSIIQENLQPAVDKAVKEYINEHPEEVMAAINDCISGGMAKALLRSIDSTFSLQLWQLKDSIQNQLNTVMTR